MIRAPEILALLVLAFSASLARADAGADFYRGTDLARDGKDREAAAVFRALVDGAPADPFADDALFELARLEEERLADPVAAARDYERLAKDYPSSRLAIRAERRAAALRQELGPGARAADAAAEWGRIFYGFAGRSRAETVRLTEAFLERHPDFPDAAHATYWLATLLRDEGRAADALARLREVQRRWGESEWGPRARAAEGEVLLAAGDLDGAERALAGMPDALRRVAVERWRRRGVVAAWILVAGAALAALAATWRAAGSLRPLLRPPAELLYLLPVALVFALAALTENVALGHAVELICAGGVVAAWLSGAALDAARARGRLGGRRVLAHVALAAAAVLAVCYIAVTRERLVDQLIETVRFGAER